MRIASGNRMCSVASMSLSSKSLFCSLHMNSLLIFCVLHISRKKMHMHQGRKFRLFFVWLKSWNWIVQAKNSSALFMQLKKSRLEELLGYLSFAVGNQNQSNSVGLICLMKVCYVCVSISPFFHQQLLFEVWTEITEINLLYGAYSICPT